MQQHQDQEGEEEQAPIILRLDRHSRATQAYRSKTQLLAQLHEYRGVLLKYPGRIDLKSWSAREGRKHIAALKQVLQNRRFEIPPGPEPDERLPDLLRLFPNP